jgi:hypothetical protein
MYYRFHLGLILGFSLLAQTAVGHAQSKSPKSAIAKNMLGKVYFSEQGIRDQQPQALMAQFSKVTAPFKIKPKDKKWTFSIAAFFRKLSYDGPMTLWFYDKADKAALKANEPVDIKSIPAQPTKIYCSELELSTETGFNKNTTYILQVGQIIGKNNQIFAKGEFTLLP